MADELLKEGAQSSPPENKNSEPTFKDRFNSTMSKTWAFMKTQKGWLWMIPALICLAIFTFWPIINTVISAFRNNFNPIAASNQDTGIGFDNFVTAVKDTYFLNCLFNTFIFTLFAVPLSTFIALLVSVALSSIKKLQSFYQSLFFLPYLTNAMAIGAVFYAMFQVVGPTKNANGQWIAESWGLLNTIFGMQVQWVNINADAWAMRFVIIFYEVWSGLPFKILILFSALQNVNKQYYDAAKIDGAKKTTVLWRVTVPLISPMISYLLITGFIGGFKAYSAIVGIFGPSMGPNNDYEMGTIVGLIYRYIESNQTGVAAAASLILFGIIMIFTAINLYVSKKRVHY